MGHGGARVGGGGPFGRRRRARLLIEAAKADPQRFGALYERYFDRVNAFVARRSGSRGENQWYLAAPARP